MDCDCAGVKTEIMSQRKLMVGWFQMLMAELREVKSELNELCELNAANIGEQRITAAQPRISKTLVTEPFPESVFMESDSNSLLCTAAVSKSSGFSPCVLPAREPEIELAPEPTCKLTKELISPKMEPEVEVDLPVEFNSPQIEHSDLTSRFDRLGEQAALALDSLFGAGSTSLGKTAQNEQFDTVPVDKNETLAPQNSDKIEHQQTPTKVKCFKCTKCAYSTPFPSRIKIHEMSHLGEKPLACDQCDYRCLQSSHLNTHKKQRHSNERSFSCDLCGYKCATNSDLIRHKRYHTGEKPFKCSHCDYRAAEKGTVRDHERMHTGEKQFKCDLCGYGTNKKATLRSHKKTHTGEKPFLCDLCDYGAVYKSNLRKHKMKKHEPQETNETLNFMSADEVKPEVLAGGSLSL